MSNRDLASFLARWVLGLLFGMVGYYKVFSMGAIEHARRFFVGGYSETWIPDWLLWAVGAAVPFVELIGGALLCLGLAVRWAMWPLAVLLIVVTYGHLLTEPFYDAAPHLMPRVLLALIVLYAYDDGDALSLDRWLRRSR